MSGTTTYFGVTYPTSTDYVKDGATAIQTVATGFDSAVAIPTYNAQTGATYTFALTDIGKTVTASNASAQTYTIPPQASVVWVTGTTLNVVNLGAGVVTFAAGAGVTVTNTAGTISQYQSAALVRTALNAWTVIPFAGGVAPLTDSAVSATTGSPTTATYTSTLNYKTYAFTGSGSITFSKAGLVDVMVVSGGGGTGSRGGGGGSAVTIQTCYVTAATHTVTIAAGGASSGGSGLQGKSGPPSSFGVGTNTAIALGLGGGGSGGNTVLSAYNGLAGSSGGGGQDTGGLGGAAQVTGLGFAGGNSSSSTGGGGGGASAVGTNGAASVGGNGGAGAANTFQTGSSVTYGGGGAGQATTAGTAGAGGGGAVTVSGTANTGGGGGGTASANTNGGSGLIVVRVLA